MKITQEMLDSVRGDYSDTEKRYIFRTICENSNARPVAWVGHTTWENIEGRNPPSFSQHEDTWHDIPLYAGYNPYEIKRLKDALNIYVSLYGANGPAIQADIEA